MLGGGGMGWKSSHMPPSQAAQKDPTGLGSSWWSVCMPWGWGSALGTPGCTGEGEHVCSLQVLELALSGRTLAPAQERKKGKEGKAEQRAISQAGGLGSRGRPSFLLSG